MISKPRLLAARPCLPLSFLFPTTLGDKMNRLLVFGALALAPLVASASCGSAFCTINTSWDAHGAWLEPGARFDLRYESIRQDQPRTGTRNIGVGEIPHHHDEGLTVNRNLLRSAHYTFTPHPGVNGLAPILAPHHHQLP